MRKITDSSSSKNITEQKRSPDLWKSSQKYSLNVRQKVVKNSALKFLLKFPTKIAPKIVRQKIQNFSYETCRTLNKFCPRLFMLPNYHPRKISKNADSALLTHLKTLSICIDFFGKFFYNFGKNVPCLIFPFIFPSDSLR